MEEIPNLDVSFWKQSFLLTPIYYSWCTTEESWGSWKKNCFQLWEVHERQLHRSPKNSVIGGKLFHPLNGSHHKDSSFLLMIRRRNNLWLLSECSLYFGHPYFDSKAIDIELRLLCLRNLCVRIQFIWVLKLSKDNGQSYLLFLSKYSIDNGQRKFNEVVMSFQGTKYSLEGVSKEHI